MEQRDLQTNINPERGRILKGIGGDYVVWNGEIPTVCKLRGSIRLTERICVGDEVEYLPSERVVERILPRRNFLLRPSVSNVDRVLFVVAPRPKPDFLLLDKILVRCAAEGVPVTLCCNKRDLGETETEEQVFRQYAASGAEILSVSAKTGEGVERIRDLLAGKLTCLSGQSAVGKSSLLNALYPKLNAETGGLARRTERGRHTTRHSEIFVCGNAMICDTPGFSSFSLEIRGERLADFYPEFAESAGRCRYRSCTHTHEPDCAVKEGVERGEIPRERYERYLELRKEIAEGRGFRTERKSRRV